MAATGKFVKEMRGKYPLRMSRGITNLLLVFFYRTIGTANYDAFMFLLCVGLWYNIG